MPDWLRKASKTLARSAPKKPEPFEIPCQCGQTVRGMRQVHAQRVVCGDCSEPSFVLPLDVYPQPKPKKKHRKRKPTKRQTFAKTKSAVKNVGPVLRKHALAQARKVGDKTAAASRRASKRVRSTFTPFRLVMLCMLAVISSTGYWVFESGKREQAELRLKAAKERGFAALHERKFITAEQEFRTASEALDRLGRDDAPARKVRQMWRETTVLTNLVDASPLEIIAQAERKIRADPTDWAEHFESHYAGRWIVLQTTLSRAAAPRATDAEHNTNTVIDLPPFLEGRQIDFQGHLAALEQLAIGAEPRHVIFAAQLGTCRLEPAESPRCVISLRSQSAFFWSDFENYRALGFREDEFHTEEEIRQLLDEQSRSMGIVE